MTASSSIGNGGALPGYDHGSINGSNSDIHCGTHDDGDLGGRLCTQGAALRLASGVCSSSDLTCFY